MKKQYVKPYLALESFQLVAALAGACNGENQIPLNHGIDTCTAEEEGGGLIFGNSCVVNYRDNPDQPCYNGVVGGGQYMTS